MRPGRSRLSSAIECRFHSSRISACSAVNTSRRIRSRTSTSVLLPEGPQAVVEDRAEPLGAVRGGKDGPLCAEPPFEDVADGAEGGSRESAGGIRRGTPVALNE